MEIKNKYAIIILVILLFATLKSKAQDKDKIDYPRNEIRASVADGIPINLVVGVGEAIIDVTSQVILSVFNTKYSTKNLDSYTKGTPLPVGLQYSYRVIPRLSIGLDYAYLGYTDVKNYEIQNDDKDLMDVYREKRNHIIHGTIKYDYIQKGNFAFYGKLGAGVLFYNYRDITEINEIVQKDRPYSGVVFSGQINPVGVSYGIKNFGAYAELGVGTKSIFEIGLYTRF